MLYKEANDHELVRAYINGKEAALHELVNRHQRKVFTSLVILVKDKDLAEDLFQDTFIKVINTLRSGNYQEEGKFLPWVMRIAHNLAIDYFRRQQRMPMVHDTEEYSVFRNIKLEEENVEDKLVMSAILNQVRQLVDELPEEQREVVMMRHYADMSFKEISDATGVSINTSLGRMRYALINLRKIIADKKIILEK